MTNLEMFYFTGKCLSIDEHPDFSEDIIKMISDDEIDWAHFVNLCSNHLILPVIYLKFKSHKLIEHLPEELAEFLKEIYELNLARNEQILLQINDILKLLNANDIYPTFLKGTGNLLDGLYKNKGERMIGDIDFLVPEKDYLKAAKILEDDGYSIRRLIYSDILDPQHYPPLFKTSEPVRVEVHRLVVPHKYGRKFNSGLIEKIRIMPFDDTSCFTLSDKHNCILNFLHSQMAHNGHLSGIISFRDIYDMYLISKRIDVCSIIKDIQYKRKAKNYFYLVGKALNLPNQFHVEDTFSSKKLYYKHSLNYTSSIFYSMNKTITFIYEKIFSIYLKMLLQSIYSKKMRLTVLKGLGSKQWYLDQYDYYSSLLK